MSKVVDGIVKDLKNIPESLRKKMKGTDKNKLIRMSIPYVIVGYFCDKSAWMFRQVEETFSQGLWIRLQGWERLLPTLCRVSIQWICFLE